MKGPDCEMLGTPPHPATKILAWSLKDKRTWRFACDEHAHLFGGPVYWISKLEAFEDNDGRPVHPIGTPEPRD